MADWNEASWMLHTGGRGIVDGVEARLGLREEKLAATREVMRQYGNTRSSSIFLVMDEMRTRSAEQGLSTAGEGLELGIWSLRSVLALPWKPCCSAQYLQLQASSNYTTAHN
jgi:hypothetical protein